MTYGSGVESDSATITLTYNSGLPGIQWEGQGSVYHVRASCSGTSWGIFLTCIATDDEESRTDTDPAYDPLEVFAVFVNLEDVNFGCATSGKNDTITITITE